MKWSEFIVAILSGGFASQLLRALVDRKKEGAETHTLETADEAQAARDFRQLALDYKARVDALETKVDAMEQRMKP